MMKKLIIKSLTFGALVLVGSGTGVIFAGVFPKATTFPSSVLMYRLPFAIAGEAR